MVRARHASIERAEIGSKGLFTDDRLDVVVGVPRGERPHHGQLVRKPGKLLKGRPIGDPGKSCLHLPGHAANSGRRGHLGIKRLRLGGTTVHKEKDHGLVLYRAAGLSRQGLDGKQVGQAETAKSQAADSKKTPSPKIFFGKRKHGWPPSAPDIAYLSARYNPRTTSQGRLPVPSRPEAVMLDTLNVYGVYFLFKRTR